MKTSHHQQAIIAFGVAIPFLLIFALVGGTLFGSGKLGENHAEKVANLERFETAKKQAYILEATMATGQRREEIKYWNSKTDQDFIQSLTDNLNGILENYDSSVLRQTAMGKATGGSTISSRTENPNSRIELSFEGGFKAMQLLMAELETVMPHLFLESLAITTPPAAAESEGGNLKFRVTYLCWEKPKA
tara:strand:- start:2178 stop:2747 length:570 start_codon:yes stop_codon:yes gene_type:complete